MNIDLEKFERLEEQFDAACSAVERASERVAELGRAVSFKRLAVSRTARLPSIFVSKPGRFRNVDGHQADDLDRAYDADPRGVLAKFERESPEHPLVALMRDHQEAVDALSKAERRLAERRAEVARLNPTVTRCREFIRSVSA